jgi:hypothetical protein
VKPVYTEVILFLHELDLLEAHLEESQHFADRIVIVESTITYSGMKKDLIFYNNRERFKRFKLEHDIVPEDVFVKIPLSYPESEHKRWFDARRNNREANVARAFKKYKKDCDYVGTCDVDEIWSRGHFPVILDLMNQKYAYIAPKIRRFLAYMDAIGSKMGHWRITRSDMDTHVRQRGTLRGNTSTEVGWHFSGCYKSGYDVRMKQIGICQSAGYHGVSAVPDEKIFENIINTGNLKALGYGAERPGALLSIDDLSWAPPFVQQNPHLYPWYPAEIRKGIPIKEWRLPS